MHVQLHDKYIMSLSCCEVTFLYIHSAWRCVLICIIIVTMYFSPIRLSDSARPWRRTRGAGWCDTARRATRRSRRPSALTTRTKRSSSRRCWARCGPRADTRCWTSRTSCAAAARTTSCRSSAGTPYNSYKLSTLLYSIYNFTRARHVTLYPPAGNLNCKVHQRRWPIEILWYQYWSLLLCRSQSTSR